MPDPYIGEIIMFGGNFAPRGWALCNGQLLPISSNAALYSILGTTYGGDGVNTFQLPDLRGRIAMHPGTGPGLPTYFLGEKAGVTSITETPAHTHGFKVPCAAELGDRLNPANAYPAVLDNAYFEKQAASMGEGTTDSAGRAGGVSVQNPFQCVNFIIALVGVYPSRNVAETDEEQTDGDQPSEETPEGSVESSD